jgi:gliding motility-associated-like protein
MKRSLLFIFYFLHFAYYSKAQILYLQDNYKGGISVDGKGYLTFDCLQPDTIVFKNSVPIGSTLKKAFIISEHHSIYSNPPKDNNVVLQFNGNTVTMDSSNIINSYYCQGATLDLVVKDVTNFALNANNKLITPNQAALISQTNYYYAYCGFLFVLLYENNTMPATNVAIFFNNTYEAGGTTPITFNFSGLNPINTTSDVGLSLWVDNVLNEADSVGFTLTSSINSFHLGDLYPDLVGSNNNMPGSFYYQNNNLFGLSDDVNSSFIDSTDAIANIKNYIANNTTNFILTDNSSLHCRNNAFILAYSTPCPARSNRDTVISYNPICSGNNVQLNGTSVGTYSWSAANNSLSNYNIPNPIANPTVTTIYIALVDSNGCKHTEHYKVNVYATPKTDSVKTTLGTCGLIPTSATIIATVGSPTTFTVNNMVQSSPTFTNLVAGTYTFALSNSFGCTYISPKAFIIKDTNIAQAHFSLTPDSGCAPLSVYCLNTSNNVGNVTNAYVWYVNNDSVTTTNFNYTFTDTGKFTITLLAYETLRQCSATTTQTLLVKYCPPTPPDSINITVPNVFSPNADDINDTWQLIVYNFNYAVNNYDCTIYDRWGIKVFETNNINTAWDGKTTSGMPSSAGTYYYIIKLTATNSKGVSEQKDFNGYLELVR